MRFTLHYTRIFHKVHDPYPLSLPTPSQHDVRHTTLSQVNQACLTLDENHVTNFTINYLHPGYCSLSAVFVRCFIIFTLWLWPTLWLGFRFAFLLLILVFFPTAFVFLRIALLVDSIFAGRWFLLCDFFNFWRLCNVLKKIKSWIKRDSCWNWNWSMLSICLEESKLVVQMTA